MSKKKISPKLLKETLNRFKLLNEYDFYQEKKEAPEYKDLILGDLEEEDMPDDAEPTDDAQANSDAEEVGADLGVDANADGGEEETTGDIPEPDAEPADDMADTEPAPAPEPASDDVEVDVTSLVKGL